MFAVRLARLSLLPIALSAGCAGGTSIPVGVPNAPMAQVSNFSHTRERVISLAETGERIALPPTGGMRESITLPVNNAHAGATLEITVSNGTPPAMKRLPVNPSQPFASFTLKSSTDVVMRGTPMLVVKLQSAPQSHGAYYAWLYDTATKHWIDLGPVGVSGSILSFGRSFEELRLRKNISYVIVPFTAAAGATCPAAIIEYPLLSPVLAVGGIAAGPDGNLWFTETRPFVGDRIARITTNGSITEFPLPPPYDSETTDFPEGITTGPDGRLWFAESFEIGAITTNGAVTEFPVGFPSSGAFIVTGPDGNLWFTETDGNKIGRISTSGSLTQFPVPTPNSVPFGIAAGPDGNLWFTERQGNKIGRITTMGTISEFLVPTAASRPNGIAAGPDANLWFTESLGGRIGRITTGGTITEFPVSPDLNQITSGPSSSLWFTQGDASQPPSNIGSITTNGASTLFAVPTAFAGPFAIVEGPDGNLWFTERSKIGKLIP
jgi:streptogramin lyase